MEEYLRGKQEQKRKTWWGTCSTRVVVVVSKLTRQAPIPLQWKIAAGNNKKRMPVVETGHPTISRQNISRDMTRHTPHGGGRIILLLRGSPLLSATSAHLAVLMTKPASMSDCVIMYVPVQANEAPTSQRRGTPLPQFNP